MVLLLVLSGDDGLVVFNVGKMLLQSVVYKNIFNSQISDLELPQSALCGRGSVLWVWHDTWQPWDSRVSSLLIFSLLKKLILVQSYT